MSVAVTRARQRTAVISVAVLTLTVCLSQSASGDPAAPFAPFTLADSHCDANNPGHQVQSIR
jgi:hypothetical protein